MYFTSFNSQPELFVKNRFMMRLFESVPIMNIRKPSKKSECKRYLGIF